MVIYRESTSHGFTNHRVEIHKTEKGWQLEPIKAFEKPKVYSDLSLLHYECRMISCSANPFIAECGKAAMELINDGCGLTAWQPLSASVS